MTVLDKLSNQESFFSQLEDIPDSVLPNNFNLELLDDQTYMLTIRKKGITYFFKESSKTGYVKYYETNKKSWTEITNDIAVDLFNNFL